MTGLGVKKGWAAPAARATAIMGDWRDVAIMADIMVIL